MGFEICGYILLNLLFGNTILARFYLFSKLAILLVSFFGFLEKSFLSTVFYQVFVGVSVLKLLFTVVGVGVDIVGDDVTAFLL